MALGMAMGMAMGMARVEKLVYIVSLGEENCDGDGDVSFVSSFMDWFSVMRQISEKKMVLESQLSD